MGGKHRCNVTLYNSMGMVADFRVVQFNATSLKETSPQTDSGYTGEVATSEQFSRVYCDMLCPSFIDVMCFFMPGCWSKLSLILIVIDGLMVVISCCCHAAKLGLVCKLFKCFCTAWMMCCFASPSKSTAFAQP